MFTTLCVSRDIPQESSDESNDASQKIESQIGGLILETTDR